MKTGIFKKILSSENDAPQPVEASVVSPVSNPFTTTPPTAGIPAPKPPAPATPTDDPFDSEDFGFEAQDDVIPLEPPPPTFALPAKRQLTPPTSAAPAAITSNADEPIRQLELRAIFGVDHDMGEEEILERSRKLKGIRSLNRLALTDTSAIDTLRAMVSRLGLRGDTMRIFAGAIPIDFIREGSITLAVQTDGGFSPGVRETLILVARELAKM